MADFDNLPSDRVSDGLDGERTGSAALLPLIFGLVGIVLGGVALFFALSGRGETGIVVEELRSELQAKTEHFNELSQQLSALQSALESVQRDEAATRARLQTLTGELSGAFNRMGAELNETRMGVRNNAAALEELVGKIQERFAAQTPAAATTSAGRTDASGSTAPEGYIEHTIRTGDSFARLAREYGVTIEAIAEANPNADPKRLQIGQIILIPRRSGGS